MRLWMCALALVGCAGRSVGYQRELVKEAYGQPVTQPRGPERVGRCEATLRLRVVDAKFAPVTGARVVVSNRVIMGAVEETLGTYQYRTDPVLTDRHGFAYVCPPGEFPPTSPWEGIGGGWTDRWRGQIDVFHGNRAATLLPPFAPQIVLR
jgi:hypothetical protein